MKQFVMKTLAGALIAAAPMMVMAESSTATGTTATLSTSASLDFKITVPKILYLRVGNLGTGATASINEIHFVPTAAQVLTNAQVAGTGGDAGGSGVNVAVISNIGAVKLTATAPLGGLVGTSTGAKIEYNQIGATSSDPTNLPHPAFGDGAAGAPNTVPVTAAGVVDRTGTWTFAYKNSAVMPADTYGGSANGGRVVYAASAP